MTRRLSSSSLMLSLLPMLILAVPGLASAQGGPTVAINQVEAKPAEGKAGYTVTAYVTVSDASGQPVTGLKAADFAVTQDGAAVTLDSAAITTRPASIVLVIDTSGSMAYEGKMAAAKDAATAFIGGLNPEDQVGIIYFNDEVTVAQNPSTDQQAGKSIIALLDAKPNGGTCLYDAAYTGVKLATSTPPGQRALVLLTDGIDETPGGGKPCSQHTLDEVIGFANQSGVDVPVYAVGVGDRVDKDDLRKIAEGTGGATLIAPAASDLTALFGTVAAQLKSQYALVYHTEAASGEHTLTVTAKSGGASGLATRGFVAPELPPSLNLTGLDSGAILDGKKTIRATIAGKAEVKKITFKLDDTVLAEDEEAPFDVTLDSAEIKPGAHKLAVQADLADGSQLLASLDFAVAAPQLGAAPGSAAAPGAAASPLSGPVPIAIGAGLLVIVVVAVVLLRRRGGAPAPLGASRALSADAFGILTVQSSVSLQKGHVFELSGETVRIGRGEDNQVVIPDAPVSRHHAEIRAERGGRQVYDLGSTYGTFVNNKKCEREGLPMKAGDKLKIGTRTMLTFTPILQPEAGMGDRTMDNIAGTIIGTDAMGTVVADELVPRAAPTTPAKTLPDKLRPVPKEHDEDTKEST